MFLETLSVARDASVVLLVIEALVLGAIPLVVLLYVTRGLRRVLAGARPFLARIRAGALRVFDGIDIALRTLAGPFVWLHMRYAALAGFFQRILD